MKRPDPERKHVKTMTLFSHAELYCQVLQIGPPNWSLFIISQHGWNTHVGLSKMTYSIKFKVEILEIATHIRKASEINVKSKKVTAAI